MDKAYIIVGAAVVITGAGLALGIDLGPGHKRGAVPHHTFNVRLRISSVNN